MMMNMINNTVMASTGSVEELQNAKLTTFSGVKPGVCFGDIFWEVCELSKY